MKIKAKIFTAVSLLFIAGYSIFLLFEEVVVSDRLQEAETKIEEEISSQNKQRRETLTKYLRLILGDSQGQTNLLLLKINDYKWIKEGFLPTTENYQKGTWFQAASLLLLNQWLDLIQNTNEDKVTSLISLSPPYLSGFYQIHTTEDLTIFAKYNANGGLVGPYIGIPYWLNDQLSYSSYGIEGLTAPEGFQYWLVFEPKELLGIDEKTLAVKPFNDLIEPLQIGVWIQSKEVYQAVIETLISSIKATKKALLDPKNESLKTQLLNDSQNWLLGKVRELPEQSLGFEATYQKFEAFNSLNVSPDEIAQIKMEEMSRRLDLERFIWEASLSFISGIFGDNMWDSSAPDGMVRSMRSSKSGLGFLLEDVMLDKKFELFDPQNISQGLDGNIQKLDSGLGILYHEGDNRVYFGNQLRMEVPSNDGSPSRVGYLSLGVDAGKIVQMIALATQETTILVAQSKVLKSYNPNGEIDQDISLTEQNFKDMKHYNEGLVIDQLGREYFFVKVQPYDNIDLEFFVFKLHTNELKLLDQLAIDMQYLISSLTIELIIFAVLLIGAILVLLGSILKGILRPISKLAEATIPLGEGDLNVHLPPLHTNQNDEVGTLYHNFELMIKKMIESEKAKSVLHKVMDPEIANELIQDENALSGKEMAATIMFVDFRSFTHLTEKMRAKEVIELLNDYMSMISSIIEEHVGVIDKYIGDAVMAMWGIKKEEKESPIKALEAAIAIQKAMCIKNEERLKEGKVILQAGIGLHQSNVFVGLMGGVNHQNFTVIGSAVNIAARVTDIARGKEIIVTSQVFDAAIGAFNFSSLGEKTLEGISMPYHLHRCEYTDSISD